MEDAEEKGYGRSRPMIDRDRVVAEALKLLDDVGVDALTMRRLAERLGIKAASLYWHVRNKEQLLGLLADEICAEIQEPEPDLHWREKLEILSRENRRVLLMHRDAARILADTVPSGPNRLRLAKNLLRTLRDAGFSQRDAMRAGLLLVDFSTYFVAEESRFAGEIDGEEHDAGEHEELARVREHWDSLPVDEYPFVADADGRFEFGLEALLDGLEMKVTPGDSREAPSG